MGAVLSRLVQQPPDWRFVSQGFLNGVALYVSGPVLLSLLRRRRVHPETWRTGASAGAMMGGFRLFAHLLRVLAHEDEQQAPPKQDLLARLMRVVRAYRLFLAGMLGTACALVVDDQWLGSLLVAWWCIRAIRSVLPTVAAAPTVLMCLSAAVLNPAAFLHQDEHEVGYQRFMDRMVLGVERSTLDGVTVPGRGIHGWAGELSFCDHMHRDLPGCHPTASCTRAVLTSVVPRVFLISLRLYAPLYLAWNAFMLRLPDARLVTNIVRSSAFLTGYTATVWMAVAHVSARVSPHPQRIHLALTSWAAGLWTLLERKERRPELAVYCAAQACNSLYLQAKKRGLITHTPKWVSYSLLALATATLTHNHDQHAGYVRTIFGFDDPAVLN